MTAAGTPDYRDFYTRQAERFADLMHATVGERYRDASHPGLRGDADLLARLRSLVPEGARGLDAGCGAGARDVWLLHRAGYPMVGIDSVPANVEQARRRHPEITDRVRVADLTEALPFDDGAFDFVLCNAVIQHIAPETVFGHTLSELARVLAPEGVLQLMWKSGAGHRTIHDREYGCDRRFNLYGVDEVVPRLGELGLSVVPARGDRLGGVMTFVDPKPMPHAVLFARREAA